jgi:hypothetical protein
MNEAFRDRLIRKAGDITITPPPVDSYVSPEEERRIMTAWFESASYAGVPEGGVLPGEPLPEIDDEEEEED